jgi:hypothetical protein
MKIRRSRGPLERKRMKKGGASTIEREREREREREGEISVRERKIKEVKFINKKMTICCQQ